MLEGTTRQLSDYFFNPFMRIKLKYIIDCIYQRRSGKGSPLGDEEVCLLTSDVIINVKNNEAVFE